MSIIAFLKDVSLIKLSLKQKSNILFKDAHGLRIQGRGYLMFFPKSLGGHSFQEKLLGGGGGSLYFGFYCIFIDKCFKICIRRVILPPPPPCVHLWIIVKRTFLLITSSNKPKLWTKLTQPFRSYLILLVILRINFKCAQILNTLFI
jgi:hypothetical protein